MEHSIRLDLVKTIRMSSKLVVFCLAIAAVSALPTLNNNGYTYTEGVSGSLDTSASVGVNYVQQPSVNYVQTVQPAVNYVQTVQPSVTKVITGSNYVQPQVTGSQYVQTTKTNYVQPQPQVTSFVQPQVTGSQYVQTTKTNYVQPQVNVVSSGSQYVQQRESPSVLISAASVGVPYVHTAGNNYVEQNYNQEVQYSQPIISKSFYTYSGPEDHDEKTAVHHITVGKPQKNYRVIFIKNPSSSVNKALIKAHIAPTEEKTVVYVLSKHQNELNIESEVDEPAPTQPSKPEVVFVKYRTPEEVRHLQEVVQNQYNVLGGVNQVSDEGFAPVRSVIGALGGASEVVESNSGSVGIGGGSTYTTGSVGIGGGSTYTSGSSEGSNTYTTGGAVSGGSNTYTTGGITSGGSNTYTTGGLVSGNLGAGGISYYENGAAASSPQYTTTTTQQKVYLPPSISSRSDSISEEDQGREISRIIKSTAKLQTIASTEKAQEEEGVTVVEENQE